MHGPLNFKFVTAVFKFWQHHIRLFHGVFLICTMLDCSPLPLWCTCCLFPHFTVWFLFHCCL